jgi:hypothetical protein
MYPASLAALPLFKAQSKDISMDGVVLEKVAECELAMAALEKGSVSDVQVGFENSSGGAAALYVMESWAHVRAGCLMLHRHDGSTWLNALCFCLQLALCA